MKALALNGECFRERTPVLQLAQASGDGGGLGFLPGIAFMGLAFYFFFVRPQRSRARHQQELTETLEIGDQVRTYGGIFGVVVRIDEDGVVLGVEEGRIRVAKAAVAARLTERAESEE
jgi:preprotein translocase subunit YajC